MSRSCPTGAGGRLLWIERVRSRAGLLAQLLSDLLVRRAQSSQRDGDFPPVLAAEANLAVGQTEELGFDPHEAHNLMIRSELMMAITRLIDRKGMTQREAADLFGVTQPRVSDVVRGKIELFTIDALVKMLSAAGVKVGVVVSG